jgi:hypothetical protein
MLCLKVRGPGGTSGDNQLPSGAGATRRFSLVVPAVRIHFQWLVLLKLLCNNGDHGYFVGLS